ncbi:MAG: peptidyl-prolyl cis-trans isomerase [candidate division KSB1 bacterium]|nr:peptidyl-prolyl cis-trans isomerase [candidate division KSB1 bacterium]
MNRGKSCWLGLILIGLILLFACSRPTPEPEVARAGKVTIPLSEFRTRYEFTPHLQQTKDIERNRRNALAALLGEKLLVAEAQRRGWQRHEKFRTYAAQMEKEAIIEALFEKEVTSQIKVTEDEIQQGLARAQFDLELQVISVNNEQQALTVKRELAAGKSFDQVGRDLQGKAAIAADSLARVTIRWGQAHPLIEEAAYNLRPDEVSDPIEVEGNFFVVKLIGTHRRALISESEYVQQRQAVVETLRSRKRAALFTSYLSSLMADKEVRVAHQVFDLVANELEKFYFDADSLARRRPLPQSLETPLDSLRKMDLADHLNEPFARFNDGRIWTVGDFLKKLIIGPYPLNFKSREALRKSLRFQIRRMIEFESLAARGKALGLEKSYYVKSQTKMWGDAYLAQQLRQEIHDTVTISNQEVQQYYATHPERYIQSELIQLQEILVDDEALAQALYRRVRNGEDMGKLARQFSGRGIGRKSDGVLGYFAPSALGRVGQVAQKLAVGEIGGPLRTETNQFSIFKVLNKRAAGPAPLTEVWNAARQDALEEKREHVLTDVLTQLAQRYSIQINQAVLDTVKLTEVNMLVLKQHFPNRTIAPLITPTRDADRWLPMQHPVRP